MEHVDADFVPDRRRLYEVKIGMGFLELPQLELPSGILRQVAIWYQVVFVGLEDRLVAQCTNFRLCPTWK